LIRPPDSRARGGFNSRCGRQCCFLQVTIPKKADATWCIENMRPRFDVIASEALLDEHGALTSGNQARYLAEAPLCRKQT